MLQSLLSLRDRFHNEDLLGRILLGILSISLVFFVIQLLPPETETRDFILLGAFDLLLIALYFLKTTAPKFSAFGLIIIFKLIILFFYYENTLIGDVAQSVLMIGLMVLSYFFVANLINKNAITICLVIDAAIILYVNAWVGLLQVPQAGSLNLFIFIPVLGIAAGLVYIYILYQEQRIMAEVSERAALANSAQIGIVVKDLIQEIERHAETSENKDQFQNLARRLTDELKAIQATNPDRYIRLRGVIVSEVKERKQGNGSFTLSVDDLYRFHIQYNEQTAYQGKLGGFDIGKTMAVSGYLESAHRRQANTHHVFVVADEITDLS